MHMSVHMNTHVYIQVNGARMTVASMLIAKNTRRAAPSSRMATTSAACKPTACRSGEPTPATVCVQLNSRVLLATTTAHRWIMSIRMPHAYFHAYLHASVYTCLHTHLYRCMSMHIGDEGTQPHHAAGWLEPDGSGGGAVRANQRGLGAASLPHVAGRCGWSLVGSAPRSAGPHRHVC